MKYTSLNPKLFFVKLKKKKKVAMMAPPTAVPTVAKNVNRCDNSNYRKKGMRCGGSRTVFDSPVTFGTVEEGRLMPAV